MRLHTIRLRGIGPFRDEAVLDIDALSGDLIAVVGVVGEGKSTLLEAWPGSIHPRRKTPTRGTFDALGDGHGKDAFVEIAFTYGEKHIRVRNDVGRDKAHVYVDGSPLPLDGKVSRVGEWVEQHLLPPEVVNASIFLPQKSEGLVAADGAERREALLLAIGIGEIEARAEQARRGTGEAKRDLADLAAKIDAGRRTAATIPDLATRHAAAAEGLRVAEEKRAELEARLHAARAALAAHQDRERERAGAAERLQAAARRSSTARARRDDLAARAGATRGLLTNAAEIRTGAVRAREIAAALPALRAAVAAAGAETDAAHGSAAAEDRTVVAERARWREADTRRARAEARRADRDAVAAALGAVEGCRAERAAAETALADLETRAAILRTVATSTSKTRIEAARDALGAVEAARRLAEAKSTARDALTADDAAAAGVDPAACAAVEAEIAAARASLAVHVEGVAAAERLAARAGDIDAAALELDDALRARGEAEGAGKDAVARGDVAKAAALAAGAKAATLAAEVAALEQEAATLADAEAREGEIAGADARLAEIEVQLVEAGAEADRIAAEHAALPAILDALPAPYLATDEAALAAVTGDLGRLGSAVGLAAQALAAAQAAAEQLAADQTALPPAEERAADWALLAESLGIGGVQALEIDAAGPALTATMNDLLHASYGSRFTAEVTASRPSRDGKRRIDECQILVTDTKKGRKGDVSTYSGGERVHLSTAFFLSLALYVCRSRQLSDPTLVLDEPGGGLGEALVGPWVDMVRDASRRIGASKVVVITHNPLVVDAADAVVRVHDGRVIVER